MDKACMHLKTESTSNEQRQQRLYVEKLFLLFLILAMKQFRRILLHLGYVDDDLNASCYETRPLPLSRAGGQGL